MHDNISLEELWRHSVLFPGVGVAIGSLARALDHLEEELARSADQLALRLRARHSRLGDRLHPEDKEYQESELQETTNAVLPRVVRGGFILTLWSTFETAAFELVYYSFKELGKPLESDPFRTGNFLKNLDKLFSKELRVPAFPDQAVYACLDELRLFRNALVHHAGKVSALPPSLRRKTGEEYAAIGLYLYEDLRHQYVAPRAVFTQRALTLVTDYLVDLSDRLYVHVHPVPIADA